MSEVARAGAADKADSGNGRAFDLAAKLHADRPPRHGPARGHGTQGADGSVQDQTRSVEWVSSNPSVASVTPKGRVIPKGNGTATIVARKGSLEASTTVKVQAMEQPAPVSFRRDVIPSFSQAGCNTGACHGTPTGKGGFRLSLRGYLPDQDFSILSHEVAGRRINPMAPETSLILRKPLGQIPHEGGLRLNRELQDLRIPARLDQGRGQGRPGGSGGASGWRSSPRHASSPRRRPRSKSPCWSMAPTSTVRDVTPICYYDSSNPTIAEVDQDGYVRFKMRGEVAIIAHYLNLVANIRLTHLVEVPGFVAASVPRGQRDRPGRLPEAQQDADPAFRDLHRPGVHPAGLPRRAGRLAHARGSQLRSWPSRRTSAAITSSTGCSSGPSFTISGHSSLPTSFAPTAG